MLTTTARPATGRHYAWYVLGVLFLTNFVAGLDRYAFFVIVEPIKREFHASDTALALVSGTAFIVTFVLVGIPVARWIDRGNRRNVLAVSVAAWSVATLLGGLASGIRSLGLSRAALGAGEAAATPACTSLIADYFPRRSRHAAISIFQSGMACSGIVGAPVIGMIAAHYGWRTALTAMGASGLVVAALLLTVQEPARGAADTAEGSTAPPPAGASWPALKALLANPPFAWLTVSQLMVGVATGILPIWFPIYLMRGYGLNIAETGRVAGYLNGVVMLLAFTGAGFIIQWLVRRPAGDRWLALAPALACAISAPFLSCMLLASPLDAVLALATLYYLLLFATRPAALSLGVELAPVQQRGLATATLVTLNSLVGAGIGSVLVGLLSDSLAPRIGAVAALRTAIGVTVVPAMLIASLAFFLVNRQMRARPAPVAAASA